MTTPLAVALYLAAIVAANVTIAALGVTWAPVVALAFVGLDLTLRDVLHSRWEGRELAPRLALLVAAGGALTWVLAPDAGRIAVASTVAFAAAVLADTLVYLALAGSSSRVRVNGSNVAGALVDSTLFLGLAFGAVAPAIWAAQVGAKVVGGALWWELLARPRRAPLDHLHGPDGREGCAECSEWDM